MPAAARCALGLDPEAAGSGPSGQASGRSAEVMGATPGDVQPLLSNLSRASAAPVLSALREIHRGYIEADRLMGSICVTGPISLQMPVVERACEVTRGTDRAEMLRFAWRFTEFGGWVFQDVADLVCAMHWTDRALDYGLELGDQRVIAYTLMRKAMIATESGNPAQGLGIANSALEYRDALTPRLRAVILRQRSYSNAALGKLSLRPGTLSKPLSKLSRAKSRARRTAHPIARRLMRKWRLARPGFASGISRPHFRFWRRAAWIGRIIRRSVIMHCACHVWRRLMPVLVSWSGHARLLAKPWHWLRGLARAA